MSKSKNTDQFDLYYEDEYEQENRMQRERERRERARSKKQRRNDYMSDWERADG